MSIMVEKPTLADANAVADEAQTPHSVPVEGAERLDCTETDRVLPRNREALVVTEMPSTWLQK
jgi:hypothetical protein